MPKGLVELLAEPIEWMKWSTDSSIQALLLDLQANILKGHGRDHTGNIFVSFAGMSPSAVAALLRTLSPLVTSALHQLRGASAYKSTGIRSGRVVCLFLGAGAYRALGQPPGKWPADAAFRAGMRPRGAALADPAPEHWGAGAWRPGNAAPDAMILVGDDSGDKVTADLEQIERLLDGTGAKVLGVERGHAFRRHQDPANKKGEGIEHFGYADGRSQPLFLAEDIAAETRAVWNPAFPPSQFLVADPLGTTPFSCGSYFVFRKLDQNVAGFKAAEEELGKKLGNGERAGAMVVGRFEDGTPTTLSGAALGGSPSNDFTYAEDPDGKRCPFRGHVRKANPRGDIVRKFGAPESAERKPIMARRGITYGKRRTRENGDFAEDDRPERDVGLLFMAYMADIAAQFEFTQASWVNNRNFVQEGTGIDPIIGQGGDQPAQSGSQLHWTDGYPPSNSADFDFHGFVTLKGGEYFFAPSLSFLQNIGQ